MVYLLFGVGIWCVCLVFGVCVFDMCGCIFGILGCIFSICEYVFGIFKFVSTLAGNPTCFPPLIKPADKRPKQRQSRWWCWSLQSKVAFCSLEKIFSEYYSFFFNWKKNSNFVQNWNKIEIEIETLLASSLSFFTYLLLFLLFSAVLHDFECNFPC